MTLYQSKQVYMQPCHNILLLERSSLPSIPDDAPLGLDPMFKRMVFPMSMVYPHPVNCSNLAQTVSAWRQQV